MKKTMVVFKLEQDNDDFPPFSEEEILADFVESDVRRIVSTPLFAKEVAHGDLVRVKNKRKCKEEYAETLFYSKAISISIIILPSARENKLETGLTVVDTLLGELNKHSQFYRTMKIQGELNIIGASFSNMNNYGFIIPFLEKMEALGHISFAELCLPEN